MAQLSAAQDAVRLCILLLEAHSTRRLEHMVERRHAGGAAVRLAEDPAAGPSLEDIDPGGIVHSEHRVAFATDL